MDAYELITSRRSTRNFKDTAIPSDVLEQIIQAGRFAPSGGNNQSTHLIVIRNQEILGKLAHMVKNAFSQMEVTPGMYPSLASAIRASKKETYVFHYQAPVLVVVCNQKEYGNNMADCACVLENMMIMANALDMGSCWINQLKWLNEDPVLLQYMQELGMQSGERVYGALALGYPDTPDGLPNRTPLERKGNPVTMVF